MMHPTLLCGFNSAENNGDEVDGAGVNDPPISPNWFLSLTTMEVIIITPDMMSVFDGCADFVAKGGPNSVTFPPETRTLVIRRAA